jgi:cyclohexanecarboxylate-CoA ligase
LTSLDEALVPVAGVAEVAGGLRELGVQPGSIVTWQSVNRDEVALAYRACWRLGAVAAPLHSRAGSDDVAAMLAALRPDFTVDLDALPSGEPVEKVWTEDTQLGAILFTSGTSSVPKGVVHTQASLAHKALEMARVHECTPNDVVLMPAPLAHISGLLNGITLPGVVPFRAVFMARWEPSDAIDLIEREHVTFMVGPPTFFVSMMQAPGFSPKRVASMRLISSGGAGVSEAFVASAREAFGAQVKRTYGSTEAPTIITDGEPIGSIDIRIDDSGELLVRGPELAQGYLDPAQNEGVFLHDGWFRTGDLAARDENGRVAIVGRLKEIIIRGGENVSIAEVEGVLEAHPAVQQAVVVGEPDELMGERVHAYVVAPSGFDLDACRAWFTERGVAKFKTPERVTVVDAIPLLPTGKPDRSALPR